MKERPILFSTPMVKAILEGKKTMTRRVIKPQPHFDKDSGYWYWKADKPGAIMANHPPDEWFAFFPSRYGQQGDRLWVKETFAVDPCGKNIYKAWSMFNDGEPVAWNWTPSIYMPRSASRITLEITDIKVELLRNIYEGDAWKEGVRPRSNQSGIGAFCELWESINDRGSWEANPWVWCISFVKI